MPWATPRSGEIARAARAGPARGKIKEPPRINVAALLWSKARGTSARRQRSKTIPKLRRHAPAGKLPDDLDADRHAHLCRFAQLALCRCRLGLGHADGLRKCLLIGVDRSAPGDRQGVDGASPSR